MVKGIKYKHTKEMILSKYNSIIKDLKQIKKQHKEFLLTPKADEIILLKKQLSYYKGRCNRFKKKLKELGVEYPEDDCVRDWLKHCK